ncbi:MAG: glycogen phosphorylase, partial [Chloroflexi bacterium]
TPRTFIFGAKAAPGYHMAKMIIKFINSIAEVVNQDLDIGDRMKVVFLPNFNVTLAEKIYPAANLSEQISMAGKEASGTGNMKFALNGALTVGTLDGANIEILERVGEGNFFTFGLSVDEVFDLKSRGYKPYVYYENQPELKLAIDQISNGVFSGGDKNLFKPLVDTFLYQDLFLNLADYASYVHCQDQVDKAFVDVEEWTKKSILNSARMGFFSSDRAVRQYNDEIWKVKPLPPG